MKEYYSTEERCINCNHIELWAIPTGMTIAAFIKDKMCPECGCSVIGEPLPKKRKPYTRKKPLKKKAKK